jgi:4-hydroxybenzoate polyprenyltransferase
MAGTTQQKTKIIDIIKALRPNQWTKNAVVFAAFVFAFWDNSQELTLQSGLIKIIPAIIIFCFVSSGIYIINDIRDLESDRIHPNKRFRPIAAGKISIKTAWIMASILLSCSLIAAWTLSAPFFTVISIYVIMQIVYSAGLKHVALVDVFVIASGFVLRAIAGAVVINVKISPWLLICTFLLALFLALCKRRHEIISLKSDDTAQRKSLEAYDAKLLDQLISISAGATVVFYSIYTLWPDTVEKFGTNALSYTIPFVIFGIFRYLDLAYRQEKGDRPDKILLTDIPILVTVALYGITVIAIFLIK